MACTDCFNGCAEIISDKCVKYTGVNIPGLGIQTGDTLMTVENKITDKILTLMNGTGIIPVLAPGDVCSIVSGFLPDCAPFNLNVVLTAIIKAICAIDARLIIAEGKITTMETALSDLNADYIIQCLDGVTVDSDTHDIVQAIIDKLCALEIDLHTNYTRTDGLNAYIANYLASQPVSNLNSNKMIPYVAYPFYGDITLFPGGSGTGIWAKVYLCNGSNGTPDLRGRTLVGATSMPGSPLSPIVAPGGANPAYTIPTPSTPTPFGANAVILTAPQLPIHDHSPITIAATVNLTGQVNDISEGYNSYGTATGVFTKITGIPNPGTPSGVDSGNTGAFSIDANHTHTATAASVGNGDAHANIQPSVAAYYIMYIP